MSILSKKFKYFYFFFSFYIDYFSYFLILYTKIMGNKYFLCFFAYDFTLNINGHNSFISYPQFVDNYVDNYVNKFLFLSSF